MPKLSADHQDVQFDWTAAERLIARLRHTAEVLDAQVSARNAMAENALAEWRGVFAEEFVHRMGMCGNDARRLADAMRHAAAALVELSARARREQQRREKLREWERDRANKSFWEKVTDQVGLTSYDDDLPPVAPPEPPHRYTATVVPVGPRH